MLFNVLILTCLSPKKYHGERQVRIRVSNNSDEEVFLLFDIDSPEKQRELGIEGTVCDVLIFYTSQKKKVLCLVELKGGDVRHAIEQLINTRKQLRRSLDDLNQSVICRPELQKINWKACIRFSGGAPQDIKTLSKELDKVFGRGNWSIERYKPGNARDANEDLSDFIRT